MPTDDGPFGLAPRLAPRPIRRFAAALARLLGRGPLASASASASSPGDLRTSGAGSASTDAVATAADAHSACEQSPRYLVRRGDTAASVAEEHGLSTASLLARNGLRLRHELVPGQLLFVGAGAGGCRRSHASAPDEIPHRTVRPGETLESIAAELGISTRVLLTANGLAGGSSLYAGLELAMPSSTDPRDTGEVRVARLAA